VILIPACSRPAAVPKGQGLESLKAQANQLCTAVTSGDNNTLADLTYPKIIEMLGGRQKFFDAVNGIQASGMKIRSVDITTFPADWAEGGGEYFAVLGKRTRLTMPDGAKKQMTGSLLAVSADRGKTWKFADAKDRATMVSVFPKLPASLSFAPSSGLQPDE
jgi:hypothetical protein